jgi:hypothetical protein
MAMKTPFRRLSRLRNTSSIIIFISTVVVA